MTGAVTVVVVNWNARDHLERCLRSLSTADVEIIVIDNASDDGSADLVRREFPQVTLVVHDGNRGFAAGVNAGVTASRTPYALILNPDTQLAPPALDRLVTTLAAEPHAGVVAGLLVDVDGRPQAGFTIRRLPTLATFAVDLLALDHLWPDNPVSRRYLYRDVRLDGDQPFDVEQPAAACLLVRREAFDELGGFDDGFTPAWFEDVDFCRRLGDAGWRILLEPRARVLHVGGVSMHRLGPSRFSTIWYGNLLRYVRKHHGPWGYRLVRLALSVGLPARAAWWWLRGRRDDAAACVHVVANAWRDTAARLGSDRACGSVRPPMPWTGQTNAEAGVYRSDDCGYEIKLVAGEVFPECPLHKRHVTWAFVRPLRRNER